MTSLMDRLTEARRWVPLPILLTIGRRRAQRMWQDPQLRAAAEASMRWLLQHTDRLDEVPELTREYVEFDVLRNYRRWHPADLIEQPVEGAEWLTTQRDHSRGVILSFMHHGQYDGLGPSLCQQGVELHGVVAPEAFDPATAIQFRQHFNVVNAHADIHLVNAADGSGRLRELLDQNAVIAIASDVPGRTPVNFMGHHLLGSFGAARLAVEKDCPVVLVTSHRLPDGRPMLKVHEPLEPSDFSDPATLLNEIFKRHEPAILAWPAAYDSPLGRLGGAVVTTD